MSFDDELQQELSSLGFIKTMNFYCGSWKGYALTLWKFGGKAWFASFAVRFAKIPSGLRKQLNAAIKEPGIKLGGVERMSKTSIFFSFSFSKEDSIRTRLQERLDCFAAALRQNGVEPANTCALTGAPSPDSLCFLKTADGASYQPVCSSKLRTDNAQLHERVEDNENNGSYLTGIIGAIFGMLVGVAVNLLTIVFMERIFALLFAFVPIASMFGYKLLKGKMNKAALVIVVALSILAIFLLPLFEFTVYFVRDYGMTVGEALSYSAQLLVMPEILSEITGELLKLVLFMAFGLFFAWRYISGQVNSNALAFSNAQINTLMPNPNYQPQPSAVETEQ